MKVMIFIDNSNFFNSVSSLRDMKKQDRVTDYHKLNNFVLNFLSKNLQYKNQNLFHVRTYYYDGEYTSVLINKIEHHLSSINNQPEEIIKVKEILDKANRRMIAQKKEINRMKSFYFFETRLKPLQYYPKQGVFQKGVDVQLAVDLVSNAYLNNYDVAVLFSGDIDLYESVRLVKSLGKQVIIFSNDDLVSEGMVTISDFYKDICKLEDGQLDEFTHIFEKKEEKHK